MERAVAFDDPAEWEDRDENVTRLYVGSELCPNLMPSGKKLKEFFQRFQNHPITLMLPFVPESYSDQAVKLIELAGDYLPGMEVVVQSWGMIDQVLERGCSPVVGRLLIKQFKDPRLLRYLKTGIPNWDLPNINGPMLSLIADMGVGRIEVDLPRWGLVLPDSLKKNSIKVSLHVPHAIISVTRFCKLAQIHRYRQELEITSCDQECKRFRYELRHPSVGVPLILHANSLLVEFSDIRHDKLDPAIDRVVRHSNLASSDRSPLA